MLFRLLLMSARREPGPIGSDDQDVASTRWNEVKGVSSTSGRLGAMKGVLTLRGQPVLNMN